MARRSDCERINEMMVRDPRLRTLPAAARLLWFELLMAMKFAGVSLLRFGDTVPDADALAVLAAMPASDVPANVDALVARGLLTREADGALGSPLLAAASARSETNRINALAGVAKRRARQVAGQMELPVLQTVGGSEHEARGGSVSETAAKRAGAEGAPLSLRQDQLKPIKGVTPAAAEFHRIGLAAFVAAGFDPAKTPPNYGIVRQWIADGASEELILRVVKAKTGPDVGHLGFFTKAIRAAVERAAQTGEGPSLVTPAGRAFEAAYRTWVNDGRVGARPQLPEFQPGGARAGEAA